MQYDRLATADGGSFLPTGRFRRNLAALLLLAFMFSAGTLFTTQRASYAATGLLAPVAALVPAAVAATSSVTTGVGAVSYFGATTSAVGAGTAVGAAGVGTVAVAPVAVAVGAVLLAGGALYLGWKWASGDSAGTQLDPAPVGAIGGCAAGFGSAVINGVSTTSDCSNLLVASNKSNAAFDLRITGYTGTVHVRAQCRKPDGTAYEYIESTSVSSGSQSQKTATCLATVDVMESVRFTQGSASDAPRFGEFALPGFEKAGSSAPSGSTTVTTRPTSKCSGGSTVTGASIVYTGATPAADLPPIIPPACPAGESRTGFTTPTTFPDGSTAPSPLAPWAAPTVPSGYPECNVAGSCVLTLLQIAPDGRVQTCSQNSACAGWSRDATEELVTSSTQTQTQTQTMPDGTTRRVVPRTRPDGSSMKCQWGPYTIPANECKVVPTEPAVEAPPKSDASNCSLSDFSLNPVSWVVVPLKCLFIPAPGSLDATATRLRDAWRGTPPAVVAGQLGTVFGPLAALDDQAGDCKGPLLAFDLPGLNKRVAYYPLNACSNLAQFVLGYVMPLLSAFTYVTAVTIGARTIMRTIGTEPPVKT